MSQKASGHWGRVRGSKLGRMIPPWAGRPSMVSDWSTGQTGSHAGNHGFGEGGPIVGIQLIYVETLGFPVFVQAEGEIEPRLALQPDDVGADLGSFGVQVIAVQVLAVGIFTSV